MAETVWAIYRDGALRLLEPVDLCEGQRVRVRVIEVETENAPRAVKEEQPVYVAVVAEETGLEQKETAPVEDAADPLEALLQRLIREGRLRPRPSGPIPPDPVSEQERLELADILGKAPGKPLSEIVIEERGDL
jgi:predicted DNA-binding antitoxin AbrB/MazE fold protein